MWKRVSAGCRVRSANRAARQLIEIFSGVCFCEISLGARAEPETHLLGGVAHGRGGGSGRLDPARVLGRGPGRGRRIRSVVAGPGVRHDRRAPAGNADAGRGRVPAPLGARREDAPEGTGERRHGASEGGCARAGSAVLYANDSRSDEGAARLRRTRAARLARAKVDHLRVSPAAPFVPRNTSSESRDSVGPSFVTREIASTANVRVPRCSPTLRKTPTRHFYAALVQTTRPYKKK